MKIRLSKISIFFLAIFVGLSSCKKDNNTVDDEGTGGDLYFNAKIDGQDYPSNIGDGKTLSISHGNLLTIKDKAGNNPGFFINIHGYSGAKTYQLSKGTGTANGSYSEIVTAVKWNFWGTTAEKPGTITIISDKNNVVEGTFSFEGYNTDTKTTKKITEGKFRLKIKH